MVKVICTDKTGQYQNLQEGIFTDSKISNVRDNKIGSNPRLQKLPVVTLHPEKKYQEIVGFGGAFTDAACYMIDQLEEDVKEELMNELFSPSQMGFSVGRTTVAQSDYGVVCYSYNDTKDDVEMKNFSIKYDEKYIIPTIKKALEINPDLYLLSSTWSPPGWMKTGGLMTGGWMRDSYVEAYANYYIRYLEEYKKAGITINALTAQNESETDQLSLMPACYWHPETEAAFAKAMIPLLKKKGLDAEVWIVDHNYAMWRRAKWMLDDPSTKEAVKAVAFHPYEGDPEVMSKLQDYHPEIDMHSTEIGGIRQNTYLTNWCHWAAMFTGIMRNRCRSIMCWNLALNELGRPHIGPFLEGKGMVNIDTKTHEIVRSTQYYALGHFSKFVKRGARCIESEGTFDGISHVAFINPDGEYVVIVTNKGPQTDLSLSIEDRFAEIYLPEESICTLVFR